MAKGRKWTNLKGVVPEETVEVSERTLQVFAEKDKRQASTMTDLAVEYAALEEEDAFADLAAKERSILYDAIERRVLEELEKVRAISGQDMWRGEGQTFSPQILLIPIVKDKGALRRWVEETGQQALLELPSGKLKEIIGEAMNADAAATMTPAERAALKPGDPASMQPPPGVEVYLRTVTHHTSAKPRTKDSPEGE